MPKLSRPSPALVVATIALFAAVGGGAVAAGHAASSTASATRHGGSLRATTASSRGARVRTGPRGPRGFTGAQGPAGPSDGFVTGVPQSQTLSGGNDTRIAQLILPAGAAYIVTATTDLGNQTNNPNPVSCTLLQSANPLTSGSAELPGANLFAATITLNDAVNASDGGVVKLSCNADSAAAARHTVMTAIRVGKLHTQSPS